MRVTAPPIGGHSMRTLPIRIRRIAALILCAACILPLGACGHRDEQYTVKLQTGPAFTVAISQTPATFNPMNAAGGLEEEFFLLCYDPLWRLDESGEPVACLAEDWSLSSDSLTWTIRLRHDAVFSDGTPLTAADVLFTYELMWHNNTAFSDYFDGVTAVRQTDDYTVVISTEYVKGDMLYNLTPILPRHIWKSYEFDPASFENTALVGSGPFVYDAENSGEDGWVFNARADHFSGRPAVGSVVFACYNTAAGAARSLSAGETDASFGLTDVQLTTLESVPGVELLESILPGADLMLLAFNTRSEIFQDAAMRQMAEYCLDREWFLDMSFGGAGRTGSSFLSPALADFTEPDGLRRYDPETAAALLRSCGYFDVDGDGRLEYGAKDAKLSVTLCSSSADAWSGAAATLLIAELEELGITVNWKKTDNNVTSICGSNKNWDMCLMSWHGGTAAAVTATWFENDIGALTGWSSEYFDSVLAQLRATRDEMTERSWSQQLQQHVYDECPVAVIAYGADVQAIRSDAWTGYESALAYGRLFRTGSIDVYMNAAPLPAA